MDASSPLERIIWGRTRAVRASLSEALASSVADGAMFAIIFCLLGRLVCSGWMVWLVL